MATRSRGQHHRPARGAEPQHQLPELAPRLRIEAGGRLIEEQDLRLADQRAGDRQPLALAPRQLAHPGVAFLRQLDVGQQRGDRPRPAVEAAKQIQHLADRKPLRQPRLL